MHIEVVLTMFKSRFSLQFSFVWKSNLELRYLSTEAITNKMGGGGGGGGVGAGMFIESLVISMVIRTLFPALENDKR